MDLYASLEIWATPYSDDPNQLAPYKVADVPGNSILTHLSYGYGLMASSFGASGSVFRETAVYNLATRDEHLFQMPAGYRVWRHMGITPKKTWVVGVAEAQGSWADLVVRYAVP